MYENFYAAKIFINSNLIKNNESHDSQTIHHGFGGGLGIEACSPELTNNIITGNVSGEGGGLWIYGPLAKPILINNTITENIADYRTGGGIFDAYS